MRMICEKSFRYGVVYGAAAILLMNIYPFFVDHCPYAAFCFDNYWDAGFPIRFYEYGSIAHLDHILYLGLITNLAFGLAVAFLTGVFVFSLSVGLRRCGQMIGGWRR